MGQLVRPLFDGPIDIVGDVHGEIDALRDLLGHLGYSDDGSHRDERRLVFLGDLTDRGPDSPAVVKIVQQLVEAGHAQCVLGNHDLNILLEDKKHDNHWFFGEEWSLKGKGYPSGSSRTLMGRFARDSLPFGCRKDVCCLITEVSSARFERLLSKEDSRH